MNNKKLFFKIHSIGVASLLTIIGFVGCNVEDDTIVNQEENLDGNNVSHTCFMAWDGECPNFDNVSTRASLLNWKNSDRIYMKLISDNDTVLAVASYSTNQNDWSVDYKGTLKNSGKCLMYYFENPAIVNSSAITLNGNSIPFADESASFTFDADENVLTLSGHLKPNCVRVRFKGDPGKAIYVAGLDAFSGYDINTGSLIVEKWIRPLTISNEEENLWYTSYVYAKLGSNSKMYVESDGVLYERSLTNKQLSNGKGGWLETPSSSYYAGWSMTDEKIPMDSLVTLKYNGAATEAQRVVIRDIVSNLVLVNGGTFTMGATADQGADASDNEKPAHQVTLWTYLINKYEVTQNEWSTIMGTSKTQWTVGAGKKYPAYYVSYNECQSFVSKLNTLSNITFCLPTEAEWEYAARGGNKSKGYKYAGSNTIEDVAWITTNAESKTHPVGLKSANELGLYDMSGNVDEWCLDLYGSYNSSSQKNPTGSSTGSYNIQRGGSWNSSATYCRVSYRNYYWPEYGYSDYGFRLACSSL